MGAVRTLLTFEQFEQLPEKPGRQELLEGDLLELPPPYIDHDEIGDRLCDCFKVAVKQLHEQGQAGWLGRAYPPVGYRLGSGSFLIPDVSITHVNQARGRYLEGSPALAVEIVSESNTPVQIERKIKLFLAFGAREVWVLYPKLRHIWIFQAMGESRKYSGHFQTPLLPGIEIDLDEILGPISCEAEAPFS